MRARLIHLLVVAACLSACRTSPPPPPPPPVEALLSQAGAMDLAGRHDAAVAIFRDVLTREPDSYRAHYGLGRALDLAGHYDEARDHFAKAIAVAAPGDKDQAQRMLAIAWTFVGNVDEASAIYQRVFDRQAAEGNFGGAADIASELGRVYLEHGDVDQADAWYRTAHDTAAREPGRPQWRIDLADIRWAHARARIAARRGLPDDARREALVVKRLIDKGGNDDQKIQYQYLAGYVAFYRRDYAAAQQALEKADQKDPFILLLLASTHEALGHADQARDYYRRVLASTSHAINNAFARPIARSKLGA